MDGVRGREELVVQDPPMYRLFRLGAEIVGEVSHPLDLCELSWLARSDPVSGSTSDARYGITGTEFCVDGRHRIMVLDPTMTPPTREAARGHTDEPAKANYPPDETETLTKSKGVESRRIGKLVL